MDELTAYQLAILGRIDTAVALGVVFMGLTLALLAIIAVRALWSR